MILIFGIYGATRTDELTKVLLTHIKEQGEVIIVRIPETKNNVLRTFTIEGFYTEYVRKYMKLRPANAKCDRFFLNYRKGKCTTQPIGRNKFLLIPKMVATFLGLENSETYTGHSLRRTSATLLCDGGGDITQLKRHGGWRSTTVAERYIENSINNKRKIGSLISSQIATVESSSNSRVTETTSTVINLVTENSTENEIQQEVNDKQELTQVQRSDVHNVVEEEPPRKIVKMHNSVMPQMNISNCTVNIYYGTKN